MPITNVPAALEKQDVIILIIQMEDVGAGGAGNSELNLISIRTHAKLRKDIGMIVNIFMCQSEGSVSSKRDN